MDSIYYVLWKRLLYFSDLLKVKCLGWLGRLLSLTMKSLLFFLYTVILYQTSLTGCIVEPVSRHKQIYATIEYSNNESKPLWVGSVYLGFGGIVEGSRGVELVGAQNQSRWSR